MIRTSLFFIFSYVPVWFLPNRQEVDVGETEIKLLQKIEELTLYLLKQKEVQQNQELAIRTLQIQNEALKNKIQSMQKQFQSK